MKRYEQKFKEDYYSILISVDSSNIKTDVIESKLNKILDWDVYDRQENMNWVEYYFTKTDFNKVKGIFNLKDKDNFVVEKI